MTDNEQKNPAQQVFDIQKLYIKDVSFEAPNSPQAFTQEWKPETNLQISSNTETLEEGVYEIVLQVTVTTRSSEQTAYLVDVQQAGIFVIRDFPKEQMGPLLGSYCPNLLYPFAREVVADLVAKGGFPQLLLSPVNFDALYAQHLQAMDEQQADASPPN